MRTDVVCKWRSGERQGLRESEKEQMDGENCEARCFVVHTAARYDLDDNNKKNEMGGEWYHACSQ
jgi:hypothetical protein